jgi:hypothetical protein
MIIVQLMGGLGNQMFQYAFGKSMASHYGCDLFFDVDVYKGNKKRNLKQTQRSYELFIYNNAQVRPMTHEMKRKLFGNRLINYIKYKLNFNRKSLYQEKTFSYNNEVFKLQTPVYLIGFWQSQQYFYDIRKSIRQDFQFNYENIGAKNEEILFKIKENIFSVSLHVRRGDYLIENIYIASTLEYYLEAIQIIKKTIPMPIFFLFSDDPQWVKTQLQPLIENSILVSNNVNENSWKDLMLMSNCNHHIIANSSFSWWGAWLGANPNKIVIAPKKWFFDDKINTADLYPRDWILI